MVDNEAIAKAIISKDPSAAEWALNRYCGNCGKFLHPEDLTKMTCRKCGTPSSQAISRPIPFLTSGTALEKLVTWVKRLPKVPGRSDEQARKSRNKLAEEYMSWIYDDDDVAELHQRVAELVVSSLRQQ